MPWKLLAFIVLMTVTLVFIGFNLENRCDLSLVFFTFQNVPIVISILGSFVLGLLAAFFLALGRPRTKEATPRVSGSVSDVPTAGGRKPSGSGKKNSTRRAAEEAGSQETPS